MPVLIFQALQSLRLAHFQAAVLAFPGVDRRLADAMLARQIRNLVAYLVLLQNADESVNWLKQLLARDRLKNDVIEEIQQHLEERTEALVAEGLSRPEAKSKASKNSAILC